MFSKLASSTPSITSKIPTKATIYGLSKTATVLDNIKAIGYKYSTIASMTVSISDMTVPESKKTLIKEAELTVETIAKNYRRGLLTNRGRYEEVIKVWENTNKQLTKDLLGGLDAYNNIFIMADSGARGSDKQIKQLAGMRAKFCRTRR